MLIYNVNGTRHHALHIHGGQTLARPTFKIDQNRLRSLREESQLTQLTVAKQVHGILKKSAQTADATILSSYQRIERTGKTSKATAAALVGIKLALDPDGIIAPGRYDGLGASGN